MRSGRFLVFVFHCDRGNLSAIKDYSHKQSDEKVPVCNLLSLISSPVGIKKGWKRYIQELRIPVQFLHQDEYEEEYGELLTQLPAVFLHTDKARSLLISADELNRMQDVEDLMILVTQKLRGLSLLHDG